MIRKALIPAAGFGTRLFPATKAIKKEFFSVVDRDGIAKPIILLIVEEALGAGLNGVIIVAQEADLESFRSFFNAPLSPEHYGKLPTDFQAYARRILEMGECVSFVIQEKQEGLGQAVYCAREAVGGQPFLLMLGDHVYRAEGKTSCARQLLGVYRQRRVSVMGLHCAPLDELGKRGVVAGSWIEDNRLLDIGQLAEKPTAAYACRNLRVPGLPDDEYLVIFGQYVVKPQLFDCLGAQIADDRRERGEFQLTSALERLRHEDGFLGLMIDGRTYDIGTPEDYLETLRAFQG